jgi:hypothetical protein
MIKTSNRVTYLHQNLNIDGSVVVCPTFTVDNTALSVDALYDNILVPTILTREFNYRNTSLADSAIYTMFPMFRVVSVGCAVLPGVVAQYITPSGYPTGPSQRQITMEVGYRSDSDIYVRLFAIDFYHLNYEIPVNRSFEIPESDTPVTIVGQINDAMMGHDGISVCCLALPDDLNGTVLKLAPFIKVEFHE